MQDRVTNSSWIAQLTARSDLKFYSIFMNEIEGVSSDLERCVQLSPVISSMVGFGKDPDNDIVYIAFPEGEVWKTISKVTFTGFRVIETPKSLASQFGLQLFYTAQSSVKVLTKSRLGSRNKFEIKDFNCSFLLPISHFTNKIICNASDIHLCSFDHDYELSTSCKTIRVEFAG